MDGDYVGYEVHRAARVASAAHGGQVLVSGAARALAGDPGDGITLRDLGEHRAQGRRRARSGCSRWRRPGLAPRLPAAADAGTRARATCPPQLTSFVGRREVADAEALLAGTRLLTLTGPGGTGKTRLSLVARRRRARSATRTAPGSCRSRRSRDPELVAVGDRGVARPAVRRRGPRRSASGSTSRDRTALLVLDNFEQVVDGCAGRRPTCCGRRRGVTVIASSRAPLRVAGEQEFPVPPLAAAAGRRARPGGRARHPRPARLFAERAAAVRPGFAITAENAADVAEIVRRLDGLPLAIELAAARVRLLSPRALAQRLDDRLGLLEGGGRDLPARQRTLRGAIDWSHDLLDPAERRLFARLAVFAGGGPLDLVERVCAAAGAIPRRRTRRRRRTARSSPTLERLAEQSLVRIEEDAHGDVAVRDARDDPRVRRRAPRRARRDPRAPGPPRARVPGARRGRRRATAPTGAPGSTASTRITTTCGRRWTTWSRPATRSGASALAVRRLAVLAHARPRRRGPRGASTGCSRCPAGPTRRPGPAARARGGRRPRVLGRRHARGRRPLRGGGRRGAPAGRRPRDRERALQPLVHPAAHERRRRLGRAPRRRRPRAARRGARDLDPPGRRGGRRPGAVGPRRALRLPRGVRRRPRTSRRGRSRSSSAPATAFWIAWTRFTRSFAPRARRRGAAAPPRTTPSACASSRRPATSPAWCSRWRRCRACLLRRRTRRGRLRAGRRRGAGDAPRPGSTSPACGPRPSPARCRTRTSAEAERCRGQPWSGDARWTREEAARTSRSPIADELAAAPPRDVPPRRRMGGVQATLPPPPPSSLDPRRTPSGRTRATPRSGAIAAASSPVTSPAPVGRDVLEEA